LGKNNQNILVIGGTGNYGKHITNALLKHNYHVKVVTRNKQKAAQLLPQEVNIIKGDINNRDDHRIMLQHVDSIVISLSSFNATDINNMVQTESESLIRLLETARNNNVFRIIYISVWNVPDILPHKIKAESAQVKASIEKYLKNNRFDYTILRSPASIDTFYQMIKNNKMIIPGRQSIPIPYIAPSDIGNIVTACIQNPGTICQMYRMCAPAPISFAEAAQKIGKTQQKEIKPSYIPMPLLKAAKPITSFLGLFSRKMRYITKVLKFADLSKKYPDNIPETVKAEHAKLTGALGNDIIQVTL
jgi:uncharacterized protein YbjT (DUF2867 family)